ncbi:MAG TPA: hypothetical protein VMF08_12480 [Candidatus Sulfotelmatobacter sp.]|nr:hypothetical protein [Candidatus Sulfotelmatobacter sp.]
MRSAPFILTILCAALPLFSRGQSVTNPPPTEIQNFEMQPDAVIVKGYGQIGTISTDIGTISVRCKESDNATTSQRQYGIAIAIQANQSRMLLDVDYDELDSLIHGLNFLSKITYDVTSMPAFDATITTRSGFRAGAHSERRQGAIQFFVQFGDTVRIPLTPDQFSQFQTYVTQAKTSLDSSMNKNQGN